MMQNELVLLDLGLFTIDLPARWDAHFFPSIPTKIRLVKDECVAVFEYFLAPVAASEGSLDFFYAENISELQRNVNGVVFEEDDEDVDYEVVVENKGEFRRYFFHGVGRFIFRITLTGSWEPQDEAEIRAMLKSSIISVDSTQSTSEIIMESFEFDHENWFRVGAMYSKREGL